MTTDAFTAAAPRSRSFWRPRLRDTTRRFRITAHRTGERAGAVASSQRQSLPGSVAPVFGKTLFDQVLACLAIVLLLPLLVVIAAAIRLDSRGPAIFRQRRHGLGHREFTVFKFRTMTQCTAAGGSDGGQQTRRGDGRVTRVGDFLRKTSLDELPQLFNVLNGTMSLVGPRPHPVAMRTEGKLCEEVVAQYSLRHSVKPGITGWAQVNGLRGATDTAEQLRRRVEHDLHYIEHRSFLFDLRILLLTPVRILFDRENAF